MSWDGHSLKFWSRFLGRRRQASDVAGTDTPTGWDIGWSRLAMQALDELADIVVRLHSNPGLVVVVVVVVVYE